MWGVPWINRILFISASLDFVEVTVNDSVEATVNNIINTYEY